MNHHIYHSHASRSHRPSQAPQRTRFGRSPRLPNPPGLRTWISTNINRNRGANNRVPEPLPVPTFAQDCENNMNHETYFKRSCQKFIREYVLFEFWLFTVFFIVVLFNQILNMELQDITIVLQVVLGGYAIYLARKQVKSVRKRENKARKAHQIFKIVILIIFLYFIRDQETRDLSESLLVILLAAVILLNLLISTLTTYVVNYSLISKLTCKINKALLGVKLLILVQGILLLIQMCLGETISWPIVLIPGWLLAVFLLFIIAKTLQFLFISHRKTFWDSEKSKKVKGVVWIFGNLVGAVITILWALLQLTLSLERLSQLLDSEISVLGFSIYMLIISASAIFYTQYFKDHIFETALQISIYFNTNKEDIYKIQQIKNGSLDQKPEEPLKYHYVTKISSSYFKSIEENEVKKLRSKGNMFTKCFKTKTPINDAESKSSTNQEEADKINSDEANKCIICFNHNPDGVFMECGHSSICFECGKEMIKAKQECHMCRSHINVLLKIHLYDSKLNIFKIVSHIRTKPVEP